ncbi:expressed protein [Phakopsora pachyrhizi]|uniref:Expressed protein n=1 Tax=Phakopsora pachyrhizi TaxID=170000 RepID=A0AAV0BL47_PHAPC|nr:expressed protein [Phakopsora pachyrhizi]
MELCTCPRCRIHSIIDENGNTHQGLYVHRSTRSKHWRKPSLKDDEFGASDMFSHLSFSHSSTSSKISNDHDKIESEVSSGSESSSNDCTKTLIVC